MFEIKEVVAVEATGSLIGNAISAVKWIAIDALLLSALAC